MLRSLQLTSVHLRVSDLARSVDYYTRQVGFVTVRSSPAGVELAAAPATPALLVLTGDPHAPPAPRDAAGLFHAALLLPSRAALGRWLTHAVQAGVTFEGFSDHGVSEALYCRDPDGNGLEFYHDRPRTAWPFDRTGELAMTSLPLDVPALLAAAAPATGLLLADARWGHLHLRVTDLGASSDFYRTTLGLTVMQSSIIGARFLAADGYHHHLGLNTWGHPRGPRPRAALGLVQATLAQTGRTALQEISDPDGIALRLTPG